MQNASAAPNWRTVAEAAQAEDSDSDSDGDLPILRQETMRVVARPNSSALAAEPESSRMPPAQTLHTPTQDRMPVAVTPSLERDTSMAGRSLDLPNCNGYALGRMLHKNDSNDLLRDLNRERQERLQRNSASHAEPASETGNTDDLLNLDHELAIRLQQEDDAAISVAHDYELALSLQKTQQSDHELALALAREQESAAGIEITQVTQEGTAAPRSPQGTAGKRKLSSAADFFSLFQRRSGSDDNGATAAQAADGLPRNSSLLHNSVAHSRDNAQTNSTEQAAAVPQNALGEGELCAAKRRRSASVRRDPVPTCEGCRGGHKAHSLICKQRWLEKQLAASSVPGEAALSSGLRLVSEFRTAPEMAVANRVGGSAVAVVPSGEVQTFVFQRSGGVIRTAVLSRGDETLMELLERTEGWEARSDGVEGLAICLEGLGGRHGAGQDASDGGLQFRASPLRRRGGSAQWTFSTKKCTPARGSICSALAECACDCHVCERRTNCTLRGSGLLGLCTLTEFGKPSKLSA